ncbi:MAG: alpha-amylase family glycosyl hydrolase, partial [Candidatus Sifarchaeia archaeon]
MNDKVKVSRGVPLPLGASLTQTGINFSLFSKHATSVTLVLFSDNDTHPFLEIPMDPKKNKTGDLWHIHIKGLGPGTEYGYRLDKLPNQNRKRHRYNNDIIVIDPYTKALSNSHEWGIRRYSNEDENPLPQHRSLVVDDAFDWASDQPLNIPLADTIIYELHVRGFTQHASSNIEHPGTYKGLIEKIPYLKDLGITAVELLPIYEFDETYNSRKDPFT